MCGPGWFAANAYNEDSGIKELYRSCLLMDMREMDDRVCSLSTDLCRARYIIGC
jgi:hypothetical protein